MLQKLIGQTVVAYLERDDEEGYHLVEGKIIDVMIDDYYFYDKNEPIYISVSLAPALPLRKGVELEDLWEIPLSQIRKK